MYKVKALQGFFDKENNKQRVAGEVFEVSEKRKDELTGKNAYNKAFVEVEMAVKENDNVEKTATIHVPGAYRVYALTDGLMNPGEWKPIDGSVQIELKPYQVLGIRFAARTIQ